MQKSSSGKFAFHNEDLRGEKILVFEIPASFTFDGVTEKVRKKVLFKKGNEIYV